MIENKKQNGSEAQPRELSMGEMDEISAGARNQEESEKLGNSEDDHK